MVTAVPPPTLAPAPGTARTASVPYWGRTGQKIHRPTITSSAGSSVALWSADGTGPVTRPPTAGSAAKVRASATALRRSAGVMPDGRT